MILIEFDYLELLELIEILVLFYFWVFFGIFLSIAWTSLLTDFFLNYFTPSSFEESPISHTVL